MMTFSEIPRTSDLILRINFPWDVFEDTDAEFFSEFPI